MGAIPVHHTATVDAPWDGPAAEARLSNDAGAATYRREYAWVDPGTDPDTKAAYKFPHHDVDQDGQPGPANVNGCSAAKGRVGQADIPDGDRAGVLAHVQAHLDDEEKSESPEEEQKESASAAPRRYGHVFRAVTEHPWAIQPPVLRLMVELVDFRASGGLLSEDEIHQRVAAADNGPRNGGARVGSVAVIPMYGVLSQRQSLMSETSGGTSIDALRASLRQALDDPKVSAIVFDVDSPGGDVAGVTEFAAEIRAARAGGKPIVAVANTACASAAYWLASQANELVCTPSGSVGSIGIWTAHQDMSGAEEQAGVKTTLISAGPYKVEGNQLEPLSDEARASLQGQVDAFYAMFVGDVAKGRGVTASQVAANYGGGREVLAGPAFQAGMVDRVDTLEATVRRMSKPLTASGRHAEGPIVFSDRVAHLADEAAAVAAHAAERARLRAKEGRPTLSARTSLGLRSSRDSIDQVLASVDPKTSDARRRGASAAWQTFVKENR